MRSYVVRAMTCDGELHGVVSNVASGATYPFTSSADLVRLLSELAPQDGIVTELTEAPVT
jgi:hypothetical protein